MWEDVNLNVDYMEWSDEALASLVSEYELDLLIDDLEDFDPEDN